MPISLQLNPQHLTVVLKSFETTIIDVTMARLPSLNTFKITPDQP